MQSLSRKIDKDSSCAFSQRHLAIQRRLNNRLNISGLRFSRACIYVSLQYDLGKVCARKTWGLGDTAAGGKIEANWVSSLARMLPYLSLSVCNGMRAYALLGAFSTENPRAADVIAMVGLYLLDQHLRPDFHAATRSERESVRYRGGCKMILFSHQKVAR